TGFTGNSLWLDPGSKSYVIFLSNRVHPVGKGNVTALRGKVATVAAAALGVVGGSGVAPGFQPSHVAVRSPERLALREPVLTGIDVLASEGFARLRGKRVALLTNQTGRSRDGVSTIDLLAHAPGVTLVA